MIEIRIAIPADLPALAATMADAFDGDPVWSWMLHHDSDSPARRRQRLALLFGALLRHSVPKERVFTTGDRQALTIWSPPGDWKLPTPAMVRAAPSIARAAGVRLPRLLGRLGDVEKHHDKQPPGHWYLEFIATASAAQGSGLGSALLQAGLDRFDADGVPVYLESSNPRNLPFYERHGFEVTGNLPVSAGPEQWTLWRKPQ
ncbi:ribosomal protein S18 acetylase RimI-like enzyme [Hamadaea flava]|uniref:GNAT family N-acetyltransferase n=1 Tax=Hamadaea flava TaxID=1742688 RepID=A0ABV8LK10_9ACTN|nr:GNAT family N-acetyltransferase [Hamadaea flava]MCP2323764.1 ribosomal protein S18 acetylase RimI-like enzyme [Hamadaea flava]